MLGAVQKGEFPPPRKLDPSIDKALEAVCLKAMALKPEDRYATPRALADDIEHWLADEPVTAYPEQRLERLGRWLRQHRTWTYAAAAALVGISLAATIGVIVVDGARRREADVRKEAETNFDMASKAVEDYLTSVSENTLFKQQDSVDIRSLRQELLNTALKYYKSFVSQRSHDPNLRRQLANAYFRVGEITQEIESRDQAIEAFHRPRPSGNRSPRPTPRIMSFKAAWPNATWRSASRKRARRPPGGDESFDRARAILEPLARGQPIAAHYQSSLADCYAEIGDRPGRGSSPAMTVWTSRESKGDRACVDQPISGQTCLPEESGRDHQRPRIRRTTRGSTMSMRSVVPKRSRRSASPSSSK